MFACALYPSDAEFIDNVAQEITYQVRQKHIKIEILFYFDRFYVCKDTQALFYGLVRLIFYTLKLF